MYMTERSFVLTCVGLTLLVLMLGFCIGAYFGKYYCDTAPVYDGLKSVKTIPRLIQI